MDSIPKSLATIVVIILGVLLCFSLILGAWVVNSARTYHNSVIDHLEASNFDEVTIEKCKLAAKEDNYNLLIERVTTPESESYYFYKVTLQYGLAAPLFGRVHTSEIVGYALSGARVDKTVPGSVPGLYETGSDYSRLLIPWDKLVADGIVSVNDGVVGTGYTSGGVNASSDTLAGDLLLPFDGSVTAVDEAGFFMCTELTGVKIPDSVETLDRSAFSGCYSLAEVHLGSGFKTAESAAFNYDSEIRAVYYNGSVEDWCKLTFNGSASNPLYPGADLYCNDRMVKEVTIPAGLTSMDSVFSGCTSLESVTIPDGTLTEVPAIAFEYCQNLTTVRIGEGVTKIKGSAFAECPSLETIYIPSTVTTIYENSFLGCKSVKKIVVADGNATYHDIDDGCLIETATNTMLLGAVVDGAACIPDGVVSLGRFAFYYNDNVQTVHFPASLESFDPDAFQSCSGLTYLTVDAGNTKYYSVDNCIIHTASKSLVLGSRYSVLPTDGSIKSIGEGAFCGSPIKSIVIPDGVTTLDDTAFCYCYLLTEITIPASVTSFGDSLFLWCASLTDIHYGGTTAQWNAISFPTYWDLKTGDYVVHCTDGDIPKATS